MTFEQVVSKHGAVWGTLRQILESRSMKAKIKIEGVAEGHPRAAREEAARNLIRNHVAVLNDVTNPEPLTQTHLKRVPREHTVYVDQALRETVRRLIGRRVGTAEAFLLDGMLEERMNHSNHAQAKTWWLTAEYLERRLRIAMLRSNKLSSIPAAALLSPQTYPAHDTSEPASSQWPIVSVPIQLLIPVGVPELSRSLADSAPEDMPNRKPDMSEAAGAAMRAVLHEVGLGNAMSGGIEPGVYLEVGGVKSSSASGFCSIA